MSFGIGIGDVVLVSGLAWDLYKACKESSENFRRLSAELMSLHAVLKETEDFLKEHPDMETSRRNRLEILTDGCNMTLRDLQAIVKRYDSLSTQAQRTWDRMHFGLQDLSEIRSRLVSSTTLLTAFNTSVINSCTSRIEKKLTKYLAEINAGLREGSVVTTPDVAETMDFPDIWAELRRELEDMGISAAVVEENRDYIRTYLRTALATGMLDEQPPSDAVPVATSLPTRNKMATPPSDSGYSSGGGSDRRPSAMSLNAAIGEFEAELARQQRLRAATETGDVEALARSSDPPTVRKKSVVDPTRLLRRLFQKDTAIVQAASDGDIEKVAKLISLGMDVNARDRWGWTALSMCGYGGHKAIARMLLDHGADLDNIDVDGDTPSGLATQRGHAELVILFDEERAARDLRLREMDTEVPRPVQV